MAHYLSGSMVAQIGQRKIYQRSDLMMTGMKGTIRLSITDSITINYINSIRINNIMRKASLHQRLTYTEQLIEKVAGFNTETTIAGPQGGKKM